LSLNEIAKRIKDVCVAHGFAWNVDDPKDIATCLLLIHSEVSEAAEALRDGKVDELKLELIGVLIRTLHLLSLLDANIDELLKSEIQRNAERPYKHGRLYF